MLANYWLKGFPAPFICENMFIVAVWWSKSLLSSRFPRFLTLHIVPLECIFFKRFTLISRLLSFAFILGLTLVI